VDKVHGALLERAQEAVDEAKRQHKRATELQAFVHALQRTEPGCLVRCAWCGKVSAAGHWIDPYRFLNSDLRERLRRNASHSICPDCLSREQERTEQHWRAKRP
jgi:hypothetical protein